MLTYKWPFPKMCCSVTFVWIGSAAFSDAISGSRYQIVLKNFTCSCLTMHFALQKVTPCCFKRLCCALHSSPVFPNNYIVSSATGSRTVFKILIHFLWYNQSKVHFTVSVIFKWNVECSEEWTGFIKLDRPISLNLWKHFNLQRTNIWYCQFYPIGLGILSLIHPQTVSSF